MCTQHCSFTHYIKFVKFILVRKCHQNHTDSNHTLSSEARGSDLQFFLIFFSIPERYRKVDIIYQTRKTVFEHISKHREEKWNATRSGIFLTNFEVKGIIVKGWHNIYRQPSLRAWITQVKLLINDFTSWHIHRVINVYSSAVSLTLWLFNKHESNLMSS